MRNSYHQESSSLKGVGIGLRSPHVLQILKDNPKVDWFELLADNHIVEGGWFRRQAMEIADRYPVTMHCVGMSLGSIDPIDYEYLKKIKVLADQLGPVLISDHLCWTSYKSHHSHDLLPLPYTEESLEHISNRISLIQDYLGCRIAIENVSAYATFKHSTINEVEFLNALAKKSDSNILFDINNLYVNHKNNGQNINTYINEIDKSRIAEIHLAGFEDKGNYYLDAHNSRVHNDVWGIYEKFKNNNIPTLVEWDHDIPDLSVLIGEVNKAKDICAGVMRKENEYAVAG